MEDFKRKVLIMKKITIIVPCYNEEEVLSIFFDRLEPIMKSLKGYSYNYLFINDGSCDDTLKILKKYAKKSSYVKIISFSRNFGKEAGLFCGINYADGDAVIPMDVDMQDPPEVIPEMVKKWEDGFEVVYGVRSDRKEDTFLKRFSSGLFYRFYNYLAEREIPNNTGDFRLMDRKVVEAIKQFKERGLFMKGVFSWVGFKSCSVEYKRAERVAGQTKWNYWKLWNFALDGITASSTVPLRIWTYMGFFCAICSLLYAVFFIIKTFIFGIDVPGYPSLLVFILFFGGIHMISIGILGEYIGRILKEVKQRPLFIIDEKIGIK